MSENIPTFCPKCGYRGRPCELGCGGTDCPMLAARRVRERLAQGLPTNLDRA